MSEFAERRRYNAATDFIDANAARHGRTVAFDDGARRRTYSDLQGATLRFAHGLAALGLKSEARIALLMLDTVDFPVAFWGAIRSGVVPIPLNTLLTSEQYAYILGDSRAEALFVSQPLVPAILPILERLPQLRTIVLVDAKAEHKAAFKREALTFEEVLSRGKTEPLIADTVSDEVAFWLYSSGSTGEPKGAKHVHSSLIATAKLFGQDVLGVRADDVGFSAAKLFFAYGLGNAMTFPMSVGGSTVLLTGRPTPDAVFEVMRRARPTIFYGVPTLYAAML
ncbi:MAG TPA: AMP-binding protein, partial [Xanthobacteraceae bacterium]|nr:AMP-binding protein [Xanthobacteraceae bacterium]